MFSAVFVFHVFRPLKVLQKFREKYKKISITEASGITKRGKGGHHQAARRAGGAAPPWAAPGTLLTASWVPSIPPFAYIYSSGWKPLISISFARTPLCTAAAAVSRSGLPGEATSEPC